MIKFYFHHIVNSVLVEKGRKPDPTLENWRRSVMCRGKTVNGSVFKRFFFKYMFLNKFAICFSYRIYAPTYKFYPISVQCMGISLKLWLYNKTFHRAIFKLNNVYLYRI